MRAGIIILVITVIAIVCLGLLMKGSVGDKPGKFDDRVSLREDHKIPYGYYAVRQVVPSLFAGVPVRSTLNSPAMWELDPDSSGRVVFLPCLRFNASENELDKIYKFVSNGNHVFIISRNLSYEAKTFLGLGVNGVVSDGYSEDEGLEVKLLAPLTGVDSSYSYEGKKYSALFRDPDSSRLLSFGTNEEGFSNFAQLRAGKGTITLHLAPLVYSNYFLLQKNNIEYLERSFSVLPDGIKDVQWNEYYFTRRDITDEKEPSWLSVLFRFPSFRWAFLTALLLLLLYAALEMRRRQRVIPVMKKPVNDSLDFVQTIGRLYYDRKDHKDLAMKMTGYFLEDVRNRFKLSTALLDKAFTESLQMKSGYPPDKLAELMDAMHFINSEPDISEDTLYRYHRQLENFYQFS